ncbi:MAG: hypothetical protein ACU84Q_13830 [Gammaproteobacteria bacterium]
MRGYQGGEKPSLVVAYTVLPKVVAHGLSANPPAATFGSRVQLSTSE